MSYDSTLDTTKHILRVKDLLREFREGLQQRGIDHDSSKLGKEEKSTFDEFTPLIAKYKYGTPERAEVMVKMKPALDHHYANNSHHPEFYENGMNGMDLFDIVELLMDWKASGERDGGNIFKSLKINKERFNISYQLYCILWNTARRMWPEAWIEDSSDMVP